ncbi:hypothetical protein LINGRAHAP2_LOCUS3916 [Linum grandiflorum]
MGAKRDVDPVNSFVKLEVVPSTSDPTLVHLRCSYNNKFIQLVTKSGYWVSWSLFAKCLLWFIVVLVTLFCLLRLLALWFVDPGYTLGLGLEYNPWLLLLLFSVFSCSYIYTYQKNKKKGISWLSATAESPDEDRTKETSTLFQPIFPAGEPYTVGFLHVQTNRHVRIFFKKDYSDSINNVACVCYTNDDGAGMYRFEFAAWVSYKEVISHQC